MHYLLLIGVLLWIAFLAPAKAIIIILAFTILLTSVIRYAVFSIASIKVSFADSAKAVGVSLFYMAIAAMTLLSLFKGNGLGGIPLLLVFGALFLSFATSLSQSLSLSFVHGSFVALISAILSTGAVVVFCQII
jgi:hypothetical protein